MPLIERSWMYCDKMEEMKAEVEPLPLVPAIWMRLRRLTSSGCTQGVSEFPLIGCRRCAHLISYSLAPINHLRDSLYVHTPSGLSYRIHNCEIRLQRIEGGHCVLLIISVWRENEESCTYRVTSRHGGPRCGEMPQALEIAESLRKP